MLLVLAILPINAINGGLNVLSVLAQEVSFDSTVHSDHSQDYRLAEGG